MDTSEEAFNKLSKEQKKQVSQAIDSGFALRKQLDRLMASKAIFQPSIEVGLSAANQIVFNALGTSCIDGHGKLLVDAIEGNTVTGKLYATCSDDVVNGAFSQTRCD